MTNTIKIDNQELLTLLEVEDSKYKKIIMCLDDEDNKVFIINGEIVKDKKIIDEIIKKYNLELPDELKGIIF